MSAAAELLGNLFVCLLIGEAPQQLLLLRHGVEEAMKLRQPREAMPLTVWMALAALAFGSVAYLVGILLFDDILALFSEKK